MMWNRAAMRRKGGIKAMQMRSAVMKLKKSSLFITARSSQQQKKAESSVQIEANEIKGESMA
jgi:hypothetical protein